jgi:hypothetical protein
MQPRACWYVVTLLRVGTHKEHIDQCLKERLRNLCTAHKLVSQDSAAPSGVYPESSVILLRAVSAIDV